MILHHCDLTLNEKILLSEIINQVTKGDITAEPDIVGCFKQKVAVDSLNKSIKELLKEGEGVEMAKSILEKITS